MEVKMSDWLIKLDCRNGSDQSTNGLRPGNRQIYPPHYKPTGVTHDHSLTKPTFGPAGCEQGMAHDEADVCNRVAFLQPAR